MNSYQRLMNTLSGKPVDRLPVFAVLGTYGAKLTGTDLRTLYSDAAAYVAGQRALQAEFGFDLAMTAFDYSAISEAFGGETAWSADQAPNMKRPAVRTAAQALALPLPDPRRTGRLPVILEATQQLAGIYKERVPIISVLPGPGILPSLMVGLEHWMETVLFDRDAARKLLHHSGDFFVAWADALLAAGADCLVVTEGMAAAEIAPRALFAELILPHLASCFARIRGPKVLHHSGGRLNHVLDLLPGLDGLVGVTVSTKDDLAEARRLLSPDLMLIGNLDNLTLPVQRASTACVCRALTALKLETVAARAVGLATAARALTARISSFACSSCTFKACKVCRCRSYLPIVADAYPTAFLSIGEASFVLRTSTRASSIVCQSRTMVAVSSAVSGTCANWDQKCPRSSRWKAAPVEDVGREDVHSKVGNTSAGL